MTVDTYLSSPTISRLHLHGEGNPSVNQHLDDLLDQAASYDSQAFLSPIDEPAPPQTLPPLVIVEGFFSFFHKRLWGAFETHLNAARAAAGLLGRRRVILSRVGPVSSLHDRACELYYSIKGGTVDYGEDHARESGHARYGRHYPTGLYPSWSKEYPIHFVTHSHGGTTITVMQSLANSGHFGSSAHPDMVASLAAVSAPFKGTPFVFMAGEEKKSAPDIKFFSINSFMTRAIHTLCYVAPIIPSFIPLPDLFHDARKMTMHELSFLEYLKAMWRSPWGETRDVISFDSTFEASDNREVNWHDPGPNTFYRTYVTCMTVKNESSETTTHHIPSYRTPVHESIWLYYISSVIGNYDYHSILPMPGFLKPKPKPKPRTNGYAQERTNGLGYTVNGTGTNHRCEEIMESPPHHQPWSVGGKVKLGEEYYANDGVVPLFSQWHPGECSPSRCLHHSSHTNPNPSPVFFGSSSNPRRMRPGIWNVCHIPDSTHLSIMPLWRGTRLQKEFWAELGEWLERVDASRAVHYYPMPTFV